MEIDRDKAIKLVIVVIATIAALALMNVAVQLITTILPFLIVAGGVYAGYRWVLSDTAAPTADEVEEQAKGLFARFRRTKEAAETVVKVGSMMNDLSGKSQTKEKKEKADVVQGQVLTQKAEAPVVEVEAEEPAEVVNSSPPVAVTPDTNEDEETRDGPVEFKDKDVLIDSKDFLQPDTSRLEEKEKEVPKVTDDVLSQIEERRRRLQQGRN